ncbi:MAG TPA: phosphatidate cytidylyltransferase [Pirellulales bacterium]|jgi:phosphatidate cytidylyltransferase
MTDQTQQRLFGYSHAFDQAITLWIVAAVAALLALAPLLILFVTSVTGASAKLHDELWKRYLSWLFLVPVMAVPVLLGAIWTILAIAALSLLCYREFARVTGLNRERTVNTTVYLGILAIHFAVLDHWYGFFVALIPLSIGAIAAVTILDDRPHGYIRRVALGSLGYALFGSGLAHLGYLANGPNYRPLILTLLVTVELNDVFAYMTGRAFGRRKLAPNTSPNKTVAGAVGALILTTGLAAGLGHFVFAGTPLSQPAQLVLFGAMISTLGQLGDLLLSSVKRDLGIKDMGDSIPGHGGILDRFDSLILVAPAVFHYVHYFVGVGLDEPARIFTLR